MAHAKHIIISSSVYGGGVEAQRRRRGGLHSLSIDCVAPPFDRFAPTSPVNGGRTL